MISFADKIENDVNMSPLFIISVTATLSYNFASTLLYRSEKKFDFCMTVCTSSYIFHLYMHLYPLCHVAMPTLIYTAMVALSAFSNFSLFTEKLHFFFDLLEQNFGEFYSHGVLRDLKIALEEYLLQDINSRIMFT